MPHDQNAPYVIVQAYESGRLPVLGPHRYSDMDEALEAARTLSADEPCTNKIVSMWDVLVADQAVGICRRLAEIRTAFRTAEPRSDTRRDLMLLIGKTMDDAQVMLDRRAR